MWPPRRFRPVPSPPVAVDTETLTPSPHKIRFNLFHHAKKDLVSATKPASGGGGESSCRRPKVNLFPQISLNDVRGKELDNVLDFTYGSDWKEAAGFTASVSWMSLGKVPGEVRDEDATKQYTERYRRGTGKVESFELPRSEVNLARWYNRK